MGRFMRGRGSRLAAPAARHSIAAAVVPMVLGLLAAASHAGAGAMPAQPSLEPRQLAMPRFFEPNLGQAAPQVGYLSRGLSSDLILTGDAALVALHRRPRIASPSLQRGDSRSEPRVASNDKTPGLTASSRPAVFRIRLLDTDPVTHLEGLEPREGRVNYLIGNNPAKWRTNVPTYDGVIRREAWPGVDVIYHAVQDLELDFVLGRRAQPGRIRFAIEGAQTATIAPGGDLTVTVAGERFSLRKPFAFQDARGHRKQISARYVLEKAQRGKSTTIEIALNLSRYDREQPLTIDPVLSYSSYLGGDNAGFPGNGAQAISIDQHGDAYIAGLTFATDFPATAGAFQTAKKGAAHAANAFVAKFNPNASGADSLVWATYLGGSGNGDAAAAIAVDGNGDVFVAGQTSSSDFPTTANAYDRSCGSDGNCNAYPCGSGCIATVPDAFVTEFSPDGSALVYSTYLGGANADAANAIALDAAAHIFVAGATASPDFPVSANAYQSLCVTCTTDPLNGAGNAFVTELDSQQSGSQQLVYSTFLGGSGVYVNPITGGRAGEVATGLALDAAANIYVTGATPSADFPHTGNAFQAACHGCANGLEDAFVSKLDSSQSGSAQLVYSTFLGGSLNNQADAIASDAAGRIYITGNTTSTDFPTTPASFTPACTPIQPGLCDAAWVAEIDPSLSGAGSLIYSTYFGTGPPAAGLGIAADQAGMIYVTGLAANVPTTPDAVPKTGGCCGSDAFITKLNPFATGADGLLYSTSMAGADGGHANRGRAIAVDAAGNFYVAGEVSTEGGVLVPDFPITANAYQSVCPDTPAPFPPGCDVAFISIFSPAAPVAAKLNASPGAIWFGSKVFGVAGATSTAHKVVLANSGDALVEDIRLGAAGDFAIDWPQTTCAGALPARSKCTMMLTFTPTALGARSGTLIIRDNAVNSPQTVRLGGRGIPGAIKRAPSVLSFGTIPVGTQSSPRSITVANASDAPLAIASVVTVGDYAESDNCGGELAAHGSCAIDVTFKPSGSGERPGKVLINDDARGSPQIVQCYGKGA